MLDLLDRFGFRAPFSAQIRKAKGLSHVSIRRLSPDNNKMLHGFS
jgi:hypothetical protein